MNGENRFYRWIRLLALGMFAALTWAAPVAGQVPAANAQAKIPQPAIVEIVPLEKNHRVLVLPGTAPEQPLEVEIKKGMLGRWELSGVGLTDPNAARWSEAWRQVLGAEVQDPELWVEALDRIGSEPLPAGVAFVEPDFRLVLRNSGENPVYLSLVESHAIRKTGTGWEKAGNIDFDRLLLIPAKNRSSVWNLLFGQDRPAALQWPLFWNSWIESLKKEPGRRVVIYRGENGGLVRVVREQIEESDWQQGIASGVAPVQNSEVDLSKREGSIDNGQKASNDNTSKTEEEQERDSYLLYVGILALILAGLAALRYRERIKKFFVGWRTPSTTPSAITSITELIERLHAAALEGLSQDPMSSSDLALRLQALTFARERMLAVAVSGTVTLPVIDPPPANDKPTAQKQQEAVLGHEVLEALRKRGGKVNIALAREFLSFLLGLEGQLAAEKQVTQQFREVKKRLDQQVGELGKKEQDLQVDKETLLGQVVEQKQKYKDLEATLNRQLGQQKKDHDEATSNLKTENSALKKSKKDLDAELAADRRLLSDLKEKGRAWDTEKGRSDAAQLELLQKNKELTGRSHTLKQERDTFELQANTLKAELDQERRDQETARTDKRVLDEKLTRIRMAGDYLRKTHLAYWDRCQHPASAAALLYNGYLGLFQTTYGAARKEPLTESAGWINLRNLMRRVGQVPGLESWEQGFGRGVYPDIDAIQISDAQIVDRNQHDKERFLQSTVLQNLLSGDLQFGGAASGRFDLSKLRGWPVFFKVEDGRVWGAS